MTVTPIPYEVVGRPDRARSVLDLLPQFIDIAERIASTEFVPKGLRNRPEAILAALMSGAERGLGPMESLRSINVIEGRPSLSAEAMRALVLAAGHDITISENTATRATLVGRRRDSERTSPPFTWTMEKARRAGLAGRGPWRAYPEAMLLARASTDLCRAVFPDVIAGLSSVEEQDDMTAADAPTTTRRTRRSTAPPTPAGELTAPPSGVSDQSAVGRALTDAGMIETEATDAPPVADNADAIPGGDRPSWAPPARDATPPISLPRLHAMIGEAFPDVDRVTQARYRHALVAIFTRGREDGPVASSSLLDLDEQLRMSEALALVTGGRASMTEEPGGAVALRAKGWVYTVTTDPLTVEVKRAPGSSPDDGAGTTTDSPAPSSGVDPEATDV